MITYLDACPRCPPGIPEASPSLGPALDVDGGKVTDHQCSACETAWSTFWRDGWPVERLIAPVSAVRASRNRVDRRAAA